MSGVLAVVRLTMLFTTSKRRAGEDKGCDYDCQGKTFQITRSSLVLSRIPGPAWLHRTDATHNDEEMVKRGSAVT